MSHTIHHYLPGLLLALLCHPSPARAHDEGGHGGGAAAQHGAAASIELAADEVAPRLQLTLARIGQSLQLQLDTAHFRFASDHADGAHVAGEGHAHLALDGHKIARVFARSHTLPSLTPGVHDVLVELVGNNHARYVVDGTPVRARAMVLWRSGQAATPVYRDITLRLAQGKVLGLPADASVHITQGETVRLQLLGDSAASLHLHGYDIEGSLAPRTPLMFFFVAEHAGRFPLTLHVDGDAPADDGGHGHQALLYLDVYPR